MDKWGQMVESFNSHYRDDYYSKVICESLLLMVEEKNLTEQVAYKVDDYLSNNDPVDALIKACNDFNITVNYE